ncbi:hypothetical protein [Halopiger djelfimassiliensis]|uniref:hypothetical protein n=1 Tax=Halopiger djelfimassiliensis TaxID=1293047 RepID=UPI0006782177|nr:hypothetical protein [Halopiger djelfimassiliensis]
MANSRLTRRGVVALAAVSLAGCASSGDDTDETTETDGNDDGGPDGLDRDVPDRDIEANWEEAARFRLWLTDYDPFGGGNRRFDYNETFPEDTDFEEVVPAFFGVITETVDGHLIQSGTQVFLGTFDAASVVAAVEDDDEYELLDEYEGYDIVAGPAPNASQQRTIAVSDEAIVVGPDYEQRIDARNGDHDRLEDVDPEFTHLFRELPHDTTVTGQYNAPSGGDVDRDEVYIWGVSSETPMAETMTWVFVLEDESHVTDEVIGDLESVSSDVQRTETDGRTVTITGAPPEIPEVGSDESGDEES